MFRREGAPAVSIIVPVYQEAGSISRLLANLEPFLGLHEIIIVDGGSEDGTFERLTERVPAATVIRTARGRAHQMNEGAARARGQLLLFVHADTAVEPEGPERALLAIDRGADMGCFQLRIDSPRLRLKAAAELQSLRSRLICSATGDQAMFIRRDVFEALDRFDESLPIVEDLDLVERFRRSYGAERFVCLGDRVSTSPRRYERMGVNKTILLMWAIRAAYHLRFDVARFERLYGPAR